MDMDTWEKKRLNGECRGLISETSCVDYCLGDTDFQCWWNIKITN